MVIVETPVVYARLRQNEPVILECLIEAYPQGVHFWEHDRGKKEVFYRLNISNDMKISLK